MSEVVLRVVVVVDDAQVEKTNDKRTRLGKQRRTAHTEIVNRIGEALQHNLMFAGVVVTPVGVGDRDILQALKNSGVDVDCGACMEVAFTGTSTAEHECKKS